MNILFLFYNLFLLTIYTIPMTLAFVLWKNSKNAVYMYVFILFLLYAIDNFVIYLTEAFEWFSHLYDSMFMTVPSFTTISFVGYLFCMLQINQLLLKQKHWIYFISGLVLLLLYLMFLPMFENSALKVWLYYTPIQIYSFTLGIHGLRGMRENPDACPLNIQKKYHRILWWTVIFSILVIIEDTIVIFNFDVYSDMLIQINNRSVTLNLMSIYYAIVAILYLDTILMDKLRRLKNIDMYASKADDKTQESIGEYEILEDETSALSSEEVLSAPVVPTSGEDASEQDFDTLTAADTETSDNDFSKFYLFCRKYQLTTREQDILTLLLENKNNQEICDELFISIGTAKAHVHNIFSKVDIKKRQQLIDLYQDFREEQGD